MVEEGNKSLEIFAVFHKRLFLCLTLTGVTMIIIISTEIANLNANLSL